MLKKYTFTHVEYAEDMQQVLKEMEYVRWDMGIEDLFNIEESDDVPRYIQVEYEKELKEYD